MRSIAGQILLWGGFLSGALATVFSTLLWSGLDIHLTDRKVETEIVEGLDRITKPEVHVIVHGVRNPSLAWEMGLRPGDRILRVDGRELSSSAAVGGPEAGKTMEFEYQRGAATRRVRLTAGEPWSTISWPWYGLSVAASILGIGLLRSGKRAAARQSGHSAASLKQLRVHLSNLVNNARKLHEEHAKMKPRETLQYIDERLADDFREFADGRDNITREYGLETFAEVMTHFAAGERAINRVWSASADGYVDEASAYIQRGLNHLTEARRVLESNA